MCTANSTLIQKYIKKQVQCLKQKRKKERKKEVNGKYKRLMAITFIYISVGAC